MKKRLSDGKRTGAFRKWCKTRPPSAMRKRGKTAEPVWSRAHLEHFSAPSIAALESEAEVENLESLV
jgi:hypothetical protein